MHLVIFLNLADKFPEASHIDDHSLYKMINPHSPYMSNVQDNPPKYTKHYPRNFLEETFVQ